MSDDIATEKKAAGKAGVKSSAKKKKEIKKSISKKATVKSSEVIHKSERLVKKNGQASTLVLDSVLTINIANELHSKFASVLKTKYDLLTVDASSVQMIDTAIIQLLYSFVSSLRAADSSVVWKLPSSEFSARVRSLGMAEKLGLDNATAD